MFTFIGIGSTNSFQNTLYTKLITYFKNLNTPKDNKNEQNCRKHIARTMKQNRMMVNARVNDKD